MEAAEVSSAAADAAAFGVGVFALAEMPDAVLARRPFFTPLRVRSRGSLRSFMDSPTRVIPKTERTSARPGKMAVHQMPEVTSTTARLRS